MGKLNVPYAPVIIMDFTLASFHRPSGTISYLKYSPERLREGQFDGKISLNAPDNIKPIQEYLLKDSQDVLVAPYRFPVFNGKDRTDISFRIVGPSPRFSLIPENVSEFEQPPTLTFQLPSITTARLSKRFLENGLTDEIVGEIQTNYEHHLSPFLEFITQAKYCLDYSQYVKLLNSVASIEDHIRTLLARDRHGFFKNLIQKQSAGKQYPIRDHEEFIARISKYKRYDNFESPNPTEILQDVIENASTHSTRIEDVCSIERTFAEFAPSLDTGFFINILSESILSEFKVQTVTRDFQSEFDLSPRELVEERYDGWTVTKTFKQLNETAYETDSLDDREKALAAGVSSDSEGFYQAIAELLYWYTEKTNGIPDEIEPRVYAVAAKLFEVTGNDYLSDAASYRASISEGRYRRKNGSFDDARTEFFYANKLATNRTEGPFDEVDVFVESILTDVFEHRETGNFGEASKKANYGHRELREGDFQGRFTKDSEQLLKAWEKDMLAHSQSMKGKFESAIETIGEAIGDFRSVNAMGPAQTAQTHRHELQAIQSQLNLDFATAADQHEKAKKEAVSTDTRHFHDVHADLCRVKQHLVEDRIEEAREKLSEHNFDEPNVNNLGILLDVYEDYLKEDSSPIERVIEQLKTPSPEPSQSRHLRYDGDYVSAIIYVVAAQRLSQRNIPSSVLRHITKAAIKNAVSGGTVREWTEVSELSQMDTDRIWQLVIPSVIQNSLEYVEYTAEKGSHPNFAAPAMKLLASLEGYLRVIVEYYAKMGYGEQWENEVSSRDKLTLADIFSFFKSDNAADQIQSRDVISAELEEVRYFDAESDIKNVRNDLDHSNLADFTQGLFEELKSHVYEVMRVSALDCPVIAEVENVSQEHQIHVASCQLQWNRVPRRVEVGTDTKLNEGQLVYLPPDIDIESGMATVDAQRIQRCELVPEEIDEM